MTRLNIRRLEDGRITAAHAGGAPVHVSVHRCFPWSEPGGYITLRDADGHEVGFIQDLDELDAQSRSAVEAALGEAAFVLEVQRIDSIEAEFEIRHWKTVTRQGPFSFQTKLDEWPQPMADGSLLLRDIAGNLIRFIDPAGMDKASQKLLWAFVD